MSDHAQNLNDPAVETHLESPLEDNDGTSSGILLEKADYEHSSPEVSSLNSSTILDHPDDVKSAAKQPTNTTTAKKKPAAASVARPVTSTVPTSAAPKTSSEVSTAVVDLNQTMPWKLFYPIASRETIIALCKATAINFILPFINGVFLGFGEICAHELAYRWGWTNSTHIVSVPGRRPVNSGNVGIRAAGSASSTGAGSVGAVSGTRSSSGFAGSRSGIGGLEFDEDAFSTASLRED
ncbi:hypothetical protein BX616_006704 [Lobosporangium transversale]|uniref:Outer membrane protein TOM13-domain-containing protein n=1 Tax=Lobosporangium transversale TaxID=64571 RepID=A0A1Y2H5P6_9FUNG|nr:outer membrane protein TOM13-domain-containing protein [Lobosporangium transversale]KAF9915186.1 hypothetical protein BX616_006704 [Lobosporangium transversale]ORZ28372.1 outer membrane protein TOM13-domain-containing protein [Lobosporangium transversale]|eukprot:XP_021886057.1 outer membrane protein TOM13-domain-containing protein [Lobosporangium transversale]